MPTITQERLALLPTPSEFGRELPFWLALCCWAFLPATKTPLIQILNIPVSAYDLILFALLPFALVSISTSKRLGTLGRLHVVFLLLLAYAGISYLWAQREGPVATGVYYTLVLAAAAFLVPYAYSRTTSSAGLLWRLTVCIALITLVYGLESLGNLGLRSPGGGEWTDFGIGRLRGPLFGASTGYFVLVPALAFSFDCLLRGIVQRLLALFVLLILSCGILLLGSRGGLLSLGFFFAFASFSLRKRKRFAFLTIAVVAFSAAGFVLATNAVTDRLTNVEDGIRSMTYETALNHFNAGTFQEKLLGSGYGSMWPWYLTDAKGEAGTSLGVVSTPYGYTAYHPHSTVLLCLSEMGIVGLGLLTALGVALLRRWYHASAANQWNCLWSGIVASLSALAVDTMLFKNWKPNCIWWFYVLGACALRLRRAAERPANSHASTFVRNWVAPYQHPRATPAPVSTGNARRVDSFF